MKLLRDILGITERDETIKGLRDRVIQLYNQREQLQVQLAGCGVAALGYGTDINKDVYGWSQSYQDVLDLYKHYDLLYKAHNILQKDVLWLR